MGYILVRDDQRHGFNTASWNEILDIATRHGWQRLGTLAPLKWNEAAKGPWEGDYTGCGWQIVTAQDADALGTALEAAMKNGDPTDVGGWSDCIERFIDFCRSGGFFIG